MNYPGFLSPSGRIGFIAPSFGCATEPYLSDFDSALEEFKNKGYTTVLGPNCYKDEGVGISNTPEKCAAEVMEFFTQDKSDVIISCGGGELMCEILPYVDFDRITSSAPKWFMGYSDNTNLTFLLNTLCDRASIYSVCASKFAKVHHTCVDDAFDVLCGTKLSVSNYDKWYKDQGDYCDICGYRQFLYKGEKETDSLKFSGRLIGGCMDCLINLVGTKFDRTAGFADRYGGDGIIWFLESCDLSVMSIRRALWQMENAGWFKNVSGFLIGRPLKFDDTFGDLDHYNAALAVLGKYDVPIIMDLDIGHQFPQMPIISGALANVEAADNTFKMEYTLS